MRRITWEAVGWVIIWIIVTLFVFYTNIAHAQEPTPYVCRADYPTVRFEFRNLPQSWLDDGFMYLADGANLIGDVLIADALTEFPPDASGITAGMALAATNDYSIILRGDASTPLCDVVASEPVDTCPAWAISGSTGALVCLFDLPYAKVE